MTALLLAPAVRANDPSPEALVEGSHWKRAKALLEPRVQANPNDAQALFLLSQVRVAYRDFKDAVALAERAAAQNPKSVEYRQQVAEAVCELAGKEKSFSLGRRCKQELEAAAALDPNHVDSRWGLMEWHMEAPWIIGGRKDEARKRLAEIQRINPSRGFLAQNRMNQYEKRADSPEPLLLKALEANPKSYSVHMALVNFYFSDGQRKYDLVEMHAREALKLEPGRTGGYGGLAIVFARQKRWPDLDAILTQAEKNVPDNFSPYFNAGNVLLTGGSDLLRTEKYFRKYLTMEPEPNLPSHADARWRLALVLEKMNRKPEAIQELQKAIELNPNHEAAKKDLKRLK
ncbi:MAG: tetratricopeptide repeat protein [Acidobacteria bacterium]|nr:tetratricopeptide repeat protein [Acidobacteriota bacterium]MBI3664220.1 tetratricopeptide repeat protein [Acidobacteriota bacterium]